MNDEILRGSVFSCLREYVRELHPHIKSKFIIEGTDALLGVKGFITFAVIFKEMIDFERDALHSSVKIKCIRVFSKVEHGTFVLKWISTVYKDDYVLTDLQNESLRIITNAAVSLGGGAVCKPSNDGFEWLLDFSLQKISV